MSDQTNTLTLSKSPFRKYLGTATVFAFFSTLIQATVSTYFANYMTDTVLIPAGTASIIMLAACLWDAINDPMMGALADRTNTRWGHYRPYLPIASILMVFATFFLFRNPVSMGTSGKVAYVAIFYILYGMSVTALTIPQGAVTVSYVGDMKQRNKVFMFSGIAAGTAFTIAASFSEKIAGWFGGGSWCWNILLYGVPLALLSFVLVKVSKERFVDKGVKRHAFKDIGCYLKHKEAWFCIVIWLMASLGYGLMFTSSVYYVKYCVASDFSQWALIGTYMLVVSLGALVSMAVFQPILMKLFKYNANKVMLVSQAVTVVLYLVLFFVGRSNFTLLCVLSFIATCFTAMEQALVSPYIADSVDFIKLKEGVAVAGVISSIKGFAYKCGTTLVNYGILAVLAATGYVENALLGMGQSESAVEAINVLRFLIPAICSLIIVICCIFYPLKKYYGEFTKMKEADQAKLAE